MTGHSTTFFGAVMLLALSAVGVSRVSAGSAEKVTGSRPWIEIRGLYGGMPTQILDRGQSLSDYGVNAVWIGSGGLTNESVSRLKKQGAKVFAEFNSMHDAAYLKDHPDAAPVGSDGLPCPPPDGWQGICPTHPGYREARMTAFRRTLQDFEIDGIWLDYHHAHASWEQAEPKLPDTCFCPRCLARFEQDTGIDLPDRPTPELARSLLGPLHEQWTNWRCGVFTDWVREFRSILDEVRPGALLGTFHCPWSDDDRDGALRSKLAIDLKAQAEYLDVFSPMPYHARFGHPTDPAWISRQVAWLGRHLGIEGKPGERTENLAHCPAFRLGRARPRIPGRRGDRPRHSSALHRNHRLRLGPSLQDLGQGRAPWPRIPLASTVKSPKTRRTCLCKTVLPVHNVLGHHQDLVTAVRDDGLAIVMVYPGAEVNRGKELPAAPPTLR